MHFVSRSLLASYFVVDGISTAVNPSELVPVVDPALEKLIDRAKKILPPDKTPKTVAKTESVIRLIGLTQAIGGLMLATGVFRRGGAALMATAFIPKLIASQQTQTNRVEKTRELALFGGALIAARDTQGKPSLRWTSQNNLRNAVAMLKSRQQQSAGNDLPSMISQRNSHRVQERKLREAASADSAK